VSNVSNLKPAWQKGQSGNPSGVNIPSEQRAKLRAARLRAMDHAGEALDTYIALMRDSIDGVKLAAAREVMGLAGLKALALDVEEVETDGDGGQKTIRVRFVDAPNAGS
jgi:hypothetical protein